MYSHIASNKRKTVVLMAFFVLFVGFLGWLFGEFTGRPAITPYVLIGALVYVLISYVSGSRLALAMNGARQIAKRDNPRLWRIVENLAITEGLPMPKVYIIDDPALNAFATGRNPNHASVAVTTGLLKVLNDNQLEGVMAHELGHIKNYDMRVSLMAFAMVAVVSLLADVALRLTWFRSEDDDNNVSPIFVVVGLIFVMLSPLIASMIQLAISRQREYLADATGALTTRYPEGLAQALEKIAGNSTLRRQNPSTAHFFIANPLKGRSIAALFSTHPPVEDRIAKLRKMGEHA